MTMTTMTKIKTTTTPIGVAVGIVRAMLRVLREINVRSMSTMTSNINDNYPVGGEEKTSSPPHLLASVMTMTTMSALSLATTAFVERDGGFGL